MNCFFLFNWHPLQLPRLAIAGCRRRHVLFTGTEFCPEAAVTELKTMPQILSTQTIGVPDWAVGLFVLVAHGMVNQSVMQLSPTTAPEAPAAPVPVRLKDMAIVLTVKAITCHYLPSWTLA